MSQQEIEQIEVTIEQAMEIIDRGRAIERLEMNPDFRRLVLDGYFADEAARLTHLLSDPVTIMQGHQDLVKNDLMSIGGFKRYLMTIRHLAAQAERDVNDARNEMEYIRVEEHAEGDDE